MENEIGKYSIDTPEQVALEFDLAGMGSRFMAVFVDHLFQGVILLIAGIVFALAAVGSSPTWMAVMFIFFGFVIEWGYFTIFETIWNGQTPGKRLVKIRAIKSSGRALTVFEAMLRNFIRVIDFLPTAYLIGMICMFVDSRNRRLGDLAAGTLVVHERDTKEAILPAWQLQSSTADPQAAVAYDIRNLGINDLELIETFLARRFDIDSYARHLTAGQLADIIRAKLGIDRTQAPDDEGFLETIAKALRDTASFHLKQ